MIKASAGGSNPLDQLDLVTRLRARVRLRSRLRQWWKRWDPRRARLPRVLANGIPKAGTHLLVRCVELLPEMVRQELELYDRRLQERLANPQVRDGVPVVLVGIGRREFVGRGKLEKLLRQLRPGEFSGAHLPYSAELVLLLERLRFRSLLVIRDPRDVAVSSMYHVLARRESPAHRHFTETLKSDDERLMACIGGVGPGGGIESRFQAFWPWLKVLLNYTTRFEWLVGPEGGGSVELQRKEIERIGQHLGFCLSREQVDSVAKGLFYEASPTFRRGQIGSWREHFKEEHKAAFKQAAGQLLIDLGYERDLDW